VSSHPDLHPSPARASRVLYALLACLFTLPVHAQDPRQTEQRLHDVRRELDAIANERRRLESERGTAARQLRQADEQVATAAQALRQTELDLAEEQIALDALRTRRNAMDSGLAELRLELARLLRARYVEGEIAPLKQILAQDRVGDISRVMAYQHYLQHHRQQRIAALQDELAALDALETEIAARQQALEAARAEQRERTRSLERDRLARARTRALLDSQYASQQAREHALGQDVRALEQLLARLREAATTTTDPAETANTPAPLQPGHMDWPLFGRLVHRFGQRLADGRRSTGLLIDAPLGTSVHAVADGAVVFSEWMTGYGMLLIVDHGHGQMSLYAHNESLLKRVGEQVRRGDAIASVGHSGGQDSTGLYFELRHDGHPVNPEQWLPRD